MERILHQIWITDTPQPEDIKQHIFGVIKGLPDTWQHRMWTDVNLPTMSPGFLDAFGRETKGALKADVLRVWILAELGGVYLDADFQPIGGIGVYNDIDWDGIEGIFWYHENPQSVWGGMGARPQLPMDNTLPNQSWGLKAGSELGIWLKAAIENAVVDRPDGLIWLGPSWLGEQVRKFVGGDLKTPHEEIKEKLAKKGYLYLPYSDLEARAYRHCALYSWEWDDKLKGKPKQ